MMLGQADNSGVQWALQGSYEQMLQTSNHFFQILPGSVALLLVRGVNIFVKFIVGVRSFCRLDVALLDASLHARTRKHAIVPPSTFLVTGYESWPHRVGRTLSSQRTGERPKPSSNLRAHDWSMSHFVRGQSCHEWLKNASHSPSCRGMTRRFKLAVSLFEWKSDSWRALHGIPAGAPT